MLDISQIALFVHVVRGGSFAEVSRRFDIPPNTISRRIAALEDALGALLFQRSTRKLTLTTAGRAFYDEVADSIETLERPGRPSSARNMPSPGSSGSRLPSISWMCSRPAGFASSCGRIPRSSSISCWATRPSI
jgi:DNA-binding transcriptional LysR family regulator